MQQYFKAGLIMGFYQKALNAMMRRVVIGNFAQAIPEHPKYLLENMYNTAINVHALNPCDYDQDVLTMWMASDCALGLSKRNDEVAHLLSFKMMDLATSAMTHHIKPKYHKLDNLDLAMIERAYQNIRAIGE